MKSRHVIYLGVIAALAAVNLGRWWWQGATAADPSAARGQPLSPQDFRLRLNVPAGSNPRRNLFAPQTSVPSTQAAMPPVRPEPIKSAAPPMRPAPVARTASSPEPTVQAPAAIPSDMDRLALLGVVFRGGQGQAYLSLNKTSVIAQSGDTVFGQFTVDKVAVDAVELRDLKNNTTRRIPIAGR